MNYLLDTNIISYYLKGDEKIKEKLKSAAIRNKIAFMNGIIYYEIKRGLLAANAISKLDKFNELINTETIILSLEDIETFDKASEIYATLKKSGNLIEDADILIAAFSLANNLILISANERHFQIIENLHIENWSK